MKIRVVHSMPRRKYGGVPPCQNLHWVKTLYVIKSFLYVIFFTVEMDLAIKLEKSGT